MAQAQAGVSLGVFREKEVASGQRLRERRRLVDARGQRSGWEGWKAEGAISLGQSGYGKCLSVVRIVAGGNLYDQWCH